jgi:hypothetical protein
LHCHSSCAAAEKARGRKGKRQQPAASEDTEYDPMRSPGLLQHLGRNGALHGWQAATGSAAGQWCCWLAGWLAGWQRTALQPVVDQAHFRMPP